MKNILNSIRVTKLFGRYDYLINLETWDNIAIIYGDNGRGKSIILNIIFHALACGINRGHKTWLANCSFKEVYMALSNGAEIYLLRDNNLLGDYIMTLKQGKRKISHKFITTQSPEGFDITEAGIDRSYLNLIQMQAEIGTHIIYLDSNRRLFVDRPSIKPFDMDDDGIILMPNGPRRTARGHPIISENDSDGAIKDTGAMALMSLRRVNSHFNKIASIASDIGEGKIHHIYAKIISDLAGTSKRTIETIKVTEALNQLQIDLPGFTKYGIMPQIDFDQIINKYKNAKDDNKENIDKVIEPFIKSLRERMSALKDVLDVIDGFISSINALLLDKKIEYIYCRGLRMITTDETELHPAKLSSGEKHLLIILSSLLVSGESDGLYIIDEPEISLNVKWQREFLPLITGQMKMKNSQVILSTHSMEIIGQNRKSLINLNKEQRHA